MLYIAVQLCEWEIVEFCLFKVLLISVNYLISVHHQ